MLAQIKKKQYKKIALVLSLCTILIWVILGTGASLAWFSDSTEELKNTFHFADFELDVCYRTQNGEWKSIEGKTDIFDNNALYEPGYVQVIYLRVDNKGDRPFDFKTAVTVTDYTKATNVFGHQFNLQDYLRFGVATANTESEMDEKVGSRPLAIAVADTKLNNYSTNSAELGAGKSTYMALVVRMPEEVQNEANYRKSSAPTVTLGITASATQKN